jgi:hypothetical protein
MTTETGDKKKTSKTLDANDTAASGRTGAERVTPGRWLMT